MMRPPRPGVRYALALLAALAFSLFYLQVSSQVGRLSRDLQYDDVGYAVDAAKHLDAAMQGIPELIRSYRELPPHSYLASLQGFLAFAIGGVHDLSLYASNAWLLAAVALLLALALRDRPAAVTVVAIAFALTSPLAYFAIAEFRPDIALGLTTALMAWFLLDAGFGENRRSLRWAALMLAASLLVKSTFFAHTLAIAVGLAIAAVVATWAQRFGWMPRFRLQARGVALFLGAGIAIASPFYFLNGAEVLEYFWSNTLGTHGHVWNFGGDMTPGQLLARFRPLMFGLARHQSQAGVVAAVALALLLWRRGEVAAAARIAALLAVAAVSATIIIFGRQPSQFFFATMHWLVLLAAVYGYARFHDGLGARGRNGLAALAVLGIVALAARNSTYTGDPWPPGAEHGGSWNERLVQLISADARGQPASRPPLAYVMVLAATAVSSHSLVWVGRLAGQPIVSPELALLSNLDEAKRVARKVDYVVVPNRDRVHEWLPVAELQRPMLLWLASEPGFEPLVPMDSKALYYVFANRDRTARFHVPGLLEAPGAFISLEHLRAEEGPYPAHVPPLPRLRWIEGREATVCMSLPAAAPLEVSIDFISRTPGTLALQWDGKTLARATLVDQGSGQLRARIVPRTPPTCLRMAIEAPANEPPLYVMVTRFRIVPAN